MEKTMENEMDTGIPWGMIGIKSLLVSLVDEAWIGVCRTCSASGDLRTPANYGCRRTSSDLPSISGGIDTPVSLAGTTVCFRKRRCQVYMPK